LCIEKCYGKINSVKIIRSVFHGEKTDKRCVYVLVSQTTLIWIQPWSVFFVLFFAVQQVQVSWLT